MPTAERVTKHIGDPIAQMAVLLEQWHLKPTRNVRWLQDFCHAFEEHEPGAWARHQRVAALGVELGALLDLSPWSQAAIRGSALLSALAGCDTNPARGSQRSKTEAQRWEEKLRGWRWLQTCAGVLDGLRPGYDDSQPLSRRGKELPIESRLLTLAEHFDELTVERGGTPRARVPEALHVLRSGDWRSHDRHLVELIWSEAGQAACSKMLRSRDTLAESALSELRASVRLLERGQPSPTKKVQRQTKADEKASVASPDVATPQEDSARPQGDAERREEMSGTITKEREEESVNTGADRMAEDPASLPARIAAAAQEMEQIRAAATRGLESLSSIAPALEELSDLVSRLQASVLRVQDGGTPPRPGDGDGNLRPIELRVEDPQDPLDVGKVVGALDSLRDLHDIHVSEQGSSWVVLRARVDPNADLAVLEGKITGSLARYLGGTDDGEAVRLTHLETG